MLLVQALSKRTEAKETKRILRNFMTLWFSNFKTASCHKSLKLRDLRYKAEHRGGPLSREHHCLLMLWACDCAEHVFTLLPDGPHPLHLNALAVGRAWADGKATVGEARKAAVALLALARELSDPAAIAVTRACGHAVATAHMADHAPGAALYAVKALNARGISADNEKRWQTDHLPQEIKKLVISTLNFRIFKPRVRLLAGTG